MVRVRIVVLVALALTLAACTQRAGGSLDDPKRHPDHDNRPAHDPADARC